MTSDILIMRAIRDTIANINPPIVPTTTLSAQAPAGATQITLNAVNNAAGNSRFISGGPITFYDTVGEEDALPIDVVTPGNPIANPTTVGIDFNNLGYAALQQTHLVNTKVYTNLQIEPPWDVEPFLVRGDPFICVFVRRELTPSGKTARRTWPIFDFQIQYHRQLNRPNDTSMDPNIWARRQMAAMRSDLKAIRQALLFNMTLNGDLVGGPQAQKFGSLDQANDWMDTNWDKVTFSADSWQLIATIAGTVTGSSMSTGG